MAQNALYFDGVDDWVEVGSVADFKFLHGALDTSSFKLTIEFWMKMPNPEPNVYYGLISTGRASSTAIGLDFFFDDRSSRPVSRRFRFNIVRGVDNDFVISWESPDNVYPNDTDWHYIALTYDQSLGSNNLKVYVDNSLVGQGTKAGFTPSTSNANYPLHIGSLGNETVEIVATIDEVRISDKVRTTGEISTAWNSGNGRKFEVDGNTVALWHFDEGSSSSVNDETANNHDGAITGASWVTGFPFPILPTPVADGDLIGIGIIRKGE